MSFLRPVNSTLRSSSLLSARSISTSRILAIQSSLPSRATATVSPNETGGLEYVPGGPVLKGTVNDATSFPPPSKTHGSYHWAFERLLSAALIPITVGAAVSSGSAYPIADGILAVSLIVHSHIGMESVLIDYIPKRKFTKAGPASLWILKIATGLSVWGVYEFNTNDVGLTELTRQIWRA